MSVFVFVASTNTALGRRESVPGTGRGDCVLNVTFRIVKSHSIAFRRVDIAMNHSPVIRSTLEGNVICVVGDVYRFLATGEDTGGKYAMWEAIVPPGGGPPPHIHSREEEGFYVLDGTVAFQLGDQRILATAGMFLNMPVGSLHSFKNESDLPARMLISVAPAGLEKMFFEVGQPTEHGVAAPPTHEDIQRLLAAAPRYGIDIRLPR